MNAPLSAVIMGGVAWNTMIYVESFPRTIPHTVFPLRSHRTVGSSGAGKAMNLAWLGADVTLWALIGDDEEGQAIRSALDDAGVRFLGELDPAGTARHTNLMDATGERISIFENAGSMEAEIDTGFAVKLFDTADLIAITIIGHCRPFLPLAVASPAPVWIDIHDYDGSNPHHVPFIEAADHLMVSSVSMTDWRSFAEAQIANEKETVVVTHGADGASGIDQSGRWVDVGVVPGDVVDTNGAGDAFFAGFSTSWLAEGDLEAAMTAGAIQAARAVASPDLAPPRAT